MRFMIAAAAALLTASTAFAGELTVVAPSPEATAVTITQEADATSENALTTAPQTVRKSYGYEGCHGTRKSNAKLIM